MRHIHTYYFHLKASMPAADYSCKCWLIMFKIVKGYVSWFSMSWLIASCRRFCLRKKKSTKSKTQQKEHEWFVQVVHCFFNIPPKLGRQLFLVWASDSFGSIPPWLKVDWMLWQCGICPLLTLRPALRKRCKQTSLHTVSETPMPMIHPNGSPSLITRFFPKKCPKIAPVHIRRYPHTLEGFGVNLNSLGFRP